MNVHQAMDAIDYGDAVSNSVINLKELLEEAGYNSLIYSKWFHQKVHKYYNPIEKLDVKNNDIVFYHFSGKSDIFNQIIKLRSKKILVYHNITPPHFFKNNKQFFNLCQMGLNQLKENINRFDGAIADSEYNKLDLIDLGMDEKKIDVIPIVFNFDLISLDKTNKVLFSNYADSRYINFLYVGRIAPNKKIEDVITIFEYYYKNINRNSRLFLVGNFDNYLDYYNELKKYIDLLLCKRNIFFTGKVSDEDLYTYYKLANIFITMSEHEGFCVPIIESMFYGIPTIAFNSGAVKYTMGNAGILVNEKKHEVIAKLCDKILNDNDLKDAIILAQRNRVLEFDTKNIFLKITNIIRKYNY
ncbi:Glycosyltransferase involved in cell wall bisynthesis [Caloramator quimbayensis]|uniref:Glycosyltransferase involved in cell wall bisynthesis n=1 Tax=Caloramator quimbayensis TaxID=1147123 RepID=A0A1T4WH11_9CLOT|nr:glycosyltransferase [Caloramator quimbayensis]SKA76613.1 Glycosyltransferase involved in cell wall bisynthesis [Caloramator quimbayensis]